MATYTRTGDKFKMVAYGGYDERGRQKKKKKTWTPTPELLRNKAKLQKELDKQLVLLQEQCDNETVSNGSIKFSAFVDLWFERYVYKDLKPTTVAFYRNSLTRLLPALGNVKLENINRRHVDNLYNDLLENGLKQNTRYIFTSDFKVYLKEHHLTRSKLSQESGVSLEVMSRMGKGLPISKQSYAKLTQHIDKNLFTPSEGEKLSPNTLQHFHKTLNAIFQKAVKWGYMEENPCKKVQALKGEHVEAAYLDDVQIEQLLELLENQPEKYRMIMHLLVASGARRGEILGLQWNDLNFEACTITILREVLYTKEMGLYIDHKGKTESALRTFALPQEVFDMLKKYKASQSEMRLQMGDRWTDEGFLFTQAYGKVMHPDTVTGWFRNFIKKHGLLEDWNGVHVHSIRHSNASLLISMGIPVTTIAQRLGHANPTITTSVYSHALKFVDTVVADALANTIYSKKEAKENRA